MTFQSDAQKILVLLFGIANAAAGGMFLWRLMQISPLDRHLVYLAVGWIALGSLMIAPSTLVSAAKQLFALLPSIRIGNGSPPAP